MRTLTLGAWYLLFLCKGCQTRQILFRDLTQGKSNFTAAYVVVCENCGHKAVYEGDQLEHYHHPAKARRAVA
jgi:hypothetical protein